MSHFVTVWQLLVCLAVVLALYFHRIILLILSAPMIKVDTVCDKETPDRKPTTGGYCVSYCQQIFVYV